VFTQYLYSIVRYEAVESASACIERLPTEGEKSLKITKIRCEVARKVAFPSSLLFSLSLPLLSTFSFILLFDMKK